MNALASRLMILRGLAGGISQRDLAELADISAAYPGALERSKTEPEMGAEIAIRIAEAVGCSIPYLVRGEGAPPPEEEVRVAVAAARERADAREAAKKAAAASVNTTEPSGDAA